MALATATRHSTETLPNSLITFEWAWPKPLLRGTLVRRYKRFLADIQLDNGQIGRAHV